MIKVGIIGSTGYAGGELARLLLQRDMFQIVDDTCMDDNMAQLADLVDVVFTATPQGLCASLINEEILSKVKVIDLSADFRIKDVNIYEQWYKIKHPTSEFIKEAVYGSIF